MIDEENDEPRNIVLCKQEENVLSHPSKISLYLLSNGGKSTIITYSLDNNLMVKDLEKTRENISLFELSKLIQQKNKLLHALLFFPKKKKYFLLI